MPPEESLDSEPSTLSCSSPVVATSALLPFLKQVVRTLSESYVTLKILKSPCNVVVALKELLDKIME
jgi:hypothetical protein